jgi:hypothetical protein
MEEHCNSEASGLDTGDGSFAPHLDLCRSRFATWERNSYFNGRTLRWSRICQDEGAMNADVPGPTSNPVYGAVGFPPTTMNRHYNLVTCRVPTLALTTV